MTLLWLGLQWALGLSLAASAGIVSILCWDWLVWRRIPHVRWKLSQFPPDATANELRLIREMVRLRRIKAAEPTPMPVAEISMNPSAGPMAELALSASA